MIRPLPTSYRALAAFLAVMLPICCCSIRITADVLDVEAISASVSPCCSNCPEAPPEDAPPPDCCDSGCGCCLKAPDTSQNTIDLSCLAILLERHPIEKLSILLTENDGPDPSTDAIETVPPDDPATAARARRITITPQV